MSDNLIAPVRTRSGRRPSMSSSVLALFDVFAACGATDHGGVHRPCASAADGEARDAFEAALKTADAETRTDAVGNQFGIFNLTGEASAPLVMMGSHLDSQPRGGRFDGALGVAAAVAVGEALMRARAEGVIFDANFCAVNWTNEEGARFRPSLLGSGVFVGRHATEEALAVRDDDGIRLGDALSAIGRRGVDRPPALPACYLELHVEQGVTLEQAGASIGVVVRNWGATKFDVTFEGEQAHTGPCPMPLRRDALLAAAHLIVEARTIAKRWPGRVHSSVGRLLVSPNSANVVPSETRLSLEIRCDDDGVLASASALADEAIERAAHLANAVAASVVRNERTIRMMPEAVCALVEAAAETTDRRSLRLDTVAGHDAISLLGHCPTGLVFVPSAGGVAHNEAEFTSTADVEAGFEVCLEAVSRLCRSGGSPERALRDMSVTP